jgi:hypothetical protein
MAVYERTAVVDAGPDDLFHLLADVAALPDYMERLVAAERVGIDRVRVTVRVAGAGGSGRLVVGEAWLRTDRAGRHLHWGADEVAGYGGELEVTGMGEVAWVRVRVLTDGDDATAEAELDATVANIRRLAAAQASAREAEAPPPS